MRIIETQRRTLERGAAQRWSKGRKRNALRGTSGHRLRAVMLLLLFLCVTEHFIIGGFFSRFPSPPIQPLCHHPQSLSASQAPRRKPDLLVFSSVRSDKSWEWGPVMIRLRGAEREGEEKRGDGWIGGGGGRGEAGGGVKVGPAASCVQQTGY